MYLSVRDDILFAAGYATIVEGLKDLNISGVELWYKEDDTVKALDPAEGKERFDLKDEADIAALKAQAEKHGITLSALCMGNNFNAPDREFQIAWNVRAIHAAEKLDIPAIRIDAIMHGESELPLEERERIVAEAIKEILARTAGSAVELGIENHGNQGNDPEFLTGLLAEVGSTRLGLTLDSGNFYWRGWPLSKIYEIFEQFAPVVKHTHIKNIGYPAEIRETQREIGYKYDQYAAPIHEGDIDHTRYISILKKAGYQRDICLEDESFGKYTHEQRKANLKATADFFRSQFED
jgi:sugar phosphate isomerase/epimerase